jgi:hypothetical protein
MSSEEPLAYSLVKTLVEAFLLNVSKIAPN